MEKNQEQPHLQELLFGTSDKAESARIGSLVKKGYAKKIAPSIYTTNLNDKPESIIKRNWFRLLSNQYPNSILSHRSALECRPTPDGHVYLTYSYTKKIVLPGLTIHFLKGHGPIEGDNPFFGQLYLAQQPRAMMENFQASRKKGAESKTLLRGQIEESLESIIRQGGETGVNDLRDRARKIAPLLGMENEFEKLNAVIGAILNTNESKILSSEVAIARRLGEPFDPTRANLFEKLYNDLAGQKYQRYPDKNDTLSAYQNFAFFESYFSNFIEGTEFTIKEARQIIHTETPLPARNEDSHDVLGTYHIVSDRNEMSIRPSDPEEMIHLLLRRHGIILSARASKSPGRFKDRNNRAGNTEFVDHKLVMGTLKKGFEWYTLLQDAFARAAYMMFMISEIHPFIDGNGRVARIMMNAELSSENLSKILVPTVYREDYMGALRRLTRQQDCGTYIRMLLRIYEFSSTIFGEDENEMEKYLSNCDAFMDPREGKLHFQTLEKT